MHTTTATDCRAIAATYGAEARYAIVTGEASAIVAALASNAAHFAARAFVLEAEAEDNARYDALERMLLERGAAPADFLSIVEASGCSWLVIAAHDGLGDRMFPVFGAELEAARAELRRRDEVRS